MKALIIGSAVILAARFCAAESVEDLPRTPDGMVIIEGEAEIILEDGKVKEVIRGRRPRNTSPRSKDKSTPSADKSKSTPSAKPGSTPSGRPGSTPSGRPGSTPSGRPGSTPSGRPGSTPGGDPNDFLPGDEGPGNEGGEEKSLQVKMLLDSDKLYMRDGTTIEGTIIIVAAKWAIILTEDGERLIPREDIEKIERGKDKDATVTLPIQESDGFQFIVMKPIEEGEEENLDEDDERTTGFKRPIKKPKSKQPLTAKPKDDVPSLKKLGPDEIMELLDKDTDKELDNLLEKLKKDDGGHGAKPPPTAKW